MNKPDQRLEIRELKITELEAKLAAANMKITAMEADVVAIRLWIQDNLQLSRGSNVGGPDGHGLAEMDAYAAICDKIDSLPAIGTVK